MRLIDADALINRCEIIYKNLETLDNGIFSPAHSDRQTIRAIIENIKRQQTIETKQIKYFDEDEKAWKIGEVIVDEQNR